MCPVGKVLTNMSQRREFWIFNLTFWLGWGSFKYLFTRTVLDETPPDYLLYVMIVTAVATAITLVLRWLYRALWERPLWLRGLVFIGGSVGAGYLWLKARGFFYYGWFAESEDMGKWLEKLGDAAEIYESVSFVKAYSTPIWVMLGWSVLYFSIRYYRVFQDYRESALKSAAMAHEAQLKMLRYQLNPHFLFNTLNAISTLILEQQAKSANRMVTRLSSFLRYSLDNDPMAKIRLAQEIKALKLYLDIEKVRFEERLGLKLDIEESAERALIPSLLLQPLVENAIKYAIAKSEEGGTLRIAARVFAGDLLLEVSDDGPGVELVNGDIPGASGVGLRNTRERLQELYGQHHSFKLANADPQGLAILIRIPFEICQD